MTTTAIPTTTTAPEVVLVPPSSLFVDGNIRKAATLDPLLVESIREHGVIVPIVAVRNADGGLLVRLGQRRTLAAIEAGDQPVPVYVVGPDDSDEAARIVDQWVENEHRAPLTTADRMAAIEQLSLGGVPADQIVKRTKASRTEVDQALVAAASKAARSAAEKHTELRLDQAAAIAEFDDEPEVAAMLVDVVVSQGPGQFAHSVQRARIELQAKAKAKAEVDRLTEGGVRVVERPDDYWNDGPRLKMRTLDGLVAPGGKKLNGTTHKSCPGHAAWIDHSGDAVYVCTDWKGNGHKGKYDSQTSTAVGAAGDPEKAKAERRRVIENNKAWPAAETVRREFVRGLLMAKSTAGMKGVAAYVAGELAWLQDRQSAIGGRAMVHELLHRTEPSQTLSEAIAKASAARADVITLGIVLAGVEGGLTRDAWRQVLPAAKRYLEFLEANGYELADVEKLAAGRKLGRRPTKAAK